MVWDVGRRDYEVRAKSASRHDEVGELKHAKTDGGEDGERMVVICGSGGDWGGAARREDGKLGIGEASEGSELGRGRGGGDRVDGGGGDAAFYDFS